jgi:uncharacterized glyoxalase superfamily protein PhnB
MYLSLTPYLYYEDPVAAMDWMERVLGFGPRQVVKEPDGRVSEAEIAVGPARVMLCGRAPAEGEGAGATLVVGVEDVDRLWASVSAAGVGGTAPRDEPYGPRSMHLTDPWGYEWYFWQGDAVYAG